MENVIKIVSWMTLIGFVNCTISKHVLMVESWPGGAKGYAMIQPPIAIQSWVLHLHFDRPVSGLEVWQGHVIRRSGTDFDIQNMDYDGKMQASQELKFDFIVRGNFDEHNYPSGLYFTTIHPEPYAFTSTGTNKPPVTTMPTTTTTTASTTSSHASRTPTVVAPVTVTLSSLLRPTTQLSQTMSSKNFVCKKFESVVAVAEHKHVTSKDSVNCDKVTSGANEDLVLSMCNVTKPDHWHRGPKVIDSCSHIPLYTPIATFNEVGTGSYLPRGAQSGIFVGCLSNGFRLIVQHCHGYPVIEHIEVGGIFNQDPDKYFVIQ